jgi:hypothetical protein
MYSPAQLQQLQMNYRQNQTDLGLPVRIYFLRTMKKQQPSSTSQNTSYCTNFLFTNINYSILFSKKIPQIYNLIKKHYGE